MIDYYKLRRGNVAIDNGGIYSYASDKGWVKDSSLLHTIHLDGDADKISEIEAKKILKTKYPGVKFQ